MKKSIYSLMLFDEIVEKVDQLAQETQSNRSQLINDILAEYFGLMTPEQKIQKILENLERNLSDRFVIEQITKNSSIHLCKNLKFKYKPKLKYCYEFVGEGEKKYATLKISSRSTSKELNAMFNEFFELIKQLEIKNKIYQSHEQDYNKSCSNNKFIREFKIQGSIARDINEVSKYLTNYLKMIDQAMNLFFIKNNYNLDRNFQLLFDYYLMPKDLQIKKENPMVLI